MPADSTRTAPRRAPLSRERVLRAAIALADDGGIESLTMRGLGQALGVEAMSLYNHVANKDDLLDGMVDLVVGDIDVPPTGTPWRSAMRARCISAHEILLAHPWAAMQITSRYNIGPGMTRYLDATLGRLREGGFSIEDALDAWNILDSHLYGFTLQQLNLPFEVDESSAVSASVLPQDPRRRVPPRGRGTHARHGPRSPGGLHTRPRPDPRRPGAETGRRVIRRGAPPRRRGRPPRVTSHPSKAIDSSPVAK